MVPMRSIRNAILSSLALLSVALAQESIAPKVTEKSYALKTVTGHYLTAENGGGAGVNTDRKEIGPWETFTMVPVSPGVFAFKTENGHYLSDVANDRRARQARGGLFANKNAVDAAAQFKLVVVNPEGPVVALVTSGGKYVTAENSGGVKARGPRATSTDRTEIGEWEQFILVAR